MPNSIEINCVLHVISMMYRDCSKSYANDVYEGSIQEGCLIHLEYRTRQYHN